MGVAEIWLLWTETKVILSFLLCNTTKQLVVAAPVPESLMHVLWNLDYVTVFAALSTRGQPPWRNFMLRTPAGLRAWYLPRKQLDGAPQSWCKCGKAPVRKVSSGNVYWQLCCQESCVYYFFYYIIFYYSNMLRVPWAYCCCVVSSDAADLVVQGKGKFEELMVCSHEIAASTAQLVAASKVGEERAVSFSHCYIYLRVMSANLNVFTFEKLT